jgi:hypothetical protein
LKINPYLFNKQSSQQAGATFENQSVSLQQARAELTELESSQQTGDTFENQSVSLQQARAELAARIHYVSIYLFF